MKKARAIILMFCLFRGLWCTAGMAANTPIETRMLKDGTLEITRCVLDDAELTIPGELFG